MNDILIPEHVIQRLERRWIGKLEQLAKMRGPSMQPVEQDDPLRSPHVERWLASSLRPPDGAPVGSGPV
jgi:hypothetical protein